MKEGKKRVCVVASWLLLGRIDGGGVVKKKKEKEEEKRKKWLLLQFRVS